MCEQTYQPTFGKLALALSKAQAVMEGAKKDSDNPFFKSKYADLESVWDACRKPLSDNEIAVIQVPSSNGSVVTVKTVLVHSSGECYEGSCSATAKDAGPQSIGSAITYLRRYALAAFVGVYQEDDDGNSAQHAKAVAKPVQAKPTNGNYAKPVDAAPVAKIFDFKAQKEGMIDAIVSGKRTPALIVTNLEKGGFVLTDDDKANIMALESIVAKMATLGVAA